MSRRTDHQRLQDIRTAIAAIHEHEEYRRGAGVPSGLVEDAVKYRLVEIGEAVGDLSADLRDRCPDVPWSRVKGMRDLLAHRYHAIDIVVVWAIVDTHLPALDLAVRTLLEADVSED